ncbi:alpha-beta hydrolase superfamily lysophospholipase [Nonomuraea thailandensis]|uniref:Alpha-beta hydrolase superfamily lysophospholipase n=1 Tax=Nonomuraea thailandensis TaxID=1188745 RepID=A0A9X2GIY6_9ACTN|nr:alpha/beta fold hydrolase [Nonomuraea thailandensis]MCP2358414.1 alpha-beta hydrolase superfamily lysophospholipase [Nonomuraea thailandensis]
MRSKVSFTADGVRCAGCLYLPADSGPAPCVVLCHGFSETMDRLFDHGERFAAEGFAALVFDHRGFDESDGEPRQVPDIGGQLADVRAALAFAREDERADPGKVLLWGNSLGGAHVTTVAADGPRIAAVVAQIPFNGFPKKVEGRSTGETLRALGRDRLGRAAGQAGAAAVLHPRGGAAGRAPPRLPLDTAAVAGFLNRTLTTRSTLDTHEQYGDIWDNGHEE